MLDILCFDWDDSIDSWLEKVQMVTWNNVHNYLNEAKTAPMKSAAKRRAANKRIHRKR